MSESLGQIGSIFEDNSVKNPGKIPSSTHFIRNIHKLLLSYKEVDKRRCQYVFLKIP